MLSLLSSQRFYFSAGSELISDLALIEPNTCLSDQSLFYHSSSLINLKQFISYAFAALCTIYSASDSDRSTVLYLPSPVSRIMQAETNIEIGLARGNF